LYLKGVGGKPAQKHAHSGQFLCSESAGHAQRAQKGSEHENTPERYILIVGTRRAWEGSEHKNAPAVVVLGGRSKVGRITYDGISKNRNV
jgi:hypothetical protein